MNRYEHLRGPRVVVLVLAASAAPSLAAPQVSDSNLLSGLAATPANVNVSTYFDDGSGTTDYGPQNATNGTGGGSGKDFVFAQNDPVERLAITGFNSALTDIRVYTATDLAPANITIYSSTSSQTSLAASNYTLLAPTATPPAYTAGSGASAGLEYADFVVNAPLGTQSLLFDFGATNIGNPQIPGFVRIAEVQAFAPEPASLSLAIFPLLGLLARRRKSL